MVQTSMRSGYGDLGHLKRIIMVQTSIRRSKELIMFSLSQNPGTAEKYSSTPVF